MKKNDLILLTAVLSYSILFYKQLPGINFLLFTIILVSGLCIKNRSLLWSRQWLIAACYTLISSFCVFLYGNTLSFISTIISLGFLSALSFNAQTSLLVGLLGSLYSILSSPVFMMIDGIKRKAVNVSAGSAGGSFMRLVFTGIAIVIASVFFFIYKLSNPVFNDFTKNISLDFISIQWIFFTIGGLFLVYPVFYHKAIHILLAKDINSGNVLNSTEDNEGAFRFISIENETYFGVVLLALLNFIIVFVNGLDISYTWIKHTWPAGMTYAEYLHQGTGTLIFSIILAISIILFCFRGRINFYQKNKWIKMLALIWVVQNVILVISTGLKDYQYIETFGLTYKRIGIYIYLTLCVVGLLSTFIKVQGSKNNWFLFRVNGWAFFTVLVFSSVFNWDTIITNYNVVKIRRGSIDVNYLVDLSDNNLPALLKLNKDSIPVVCDSLGEIYGSWVTDPQTLIHHKLYDFLKKERQYSDWRSFCLSDHNAMLEINEIDKNGNLSRLELGGTNIDSLRPLESLLNLKELNISRCGISDFTPLRSFHKLEKLNVSACSLIDTMEFPVLPGLKQLNLSDNNIANLYFLKGDTSLESLDIKGYSSTVLSTLPLLPHLENLTISLINDDLNLDAIDHLCGFKSLKKLHVGKLTAVQLDKIHSILPNLEVVATN